MAQLNLELYIFNTYLKTYTFFIFLIIISNWLQTNVYFFFYNLLGILSYNIVVEIAKKYVRYNVCFIYLLQPNIPNGTESLNSTFQDKTVIKNG